LLLILPLLAGAAKAVRSQDIGAVVSANLRRRRNLEALSTARIDSVDLKVARARSAEIRQLVFTHSPREKHAGTQRL
jgi:hypothetical protein